MYIFTPPPLSKAAWSWLREWQHNNGISDKDFAAGLKLNKNTLKSYDVSAHTLTIEKLDNLIATVGVEPLFYVVNKYVQYVSYLRNSSAYGTQANPCYPQRSIWKSY